MADNKTDDDHDFYDPHAERKANEGFAAPTVFKTVKPGDEVNLTRLDPALRTAMVALGWDLKKFDRDPPDLDASAFLLNRHEKTREDSDFIFYNSLTGSEGAVRHTGDSRTGAGEGDDETIILDLQSLPFDVAKIVFVVSIYDLDMNENNFSHVKNVYFRIVNQATEQEMLRFELHEDILAGGTGLIVAEIERMGSEWLFRARGETIRGGLGKIASDYGIMVQQIVQN